MGTRAGVYGAQYKGDFMKILFSNMGYAKGIDGTLWQHVSRASRHLYCPVPIQTHILGQLKDIMKKEDPDLCCFVEIDQGSFHSAYLNQLQYLVGPEYPFFDIANKYGENSWRRKIPLYGSRSNAFISRKELEFDRLYFRNGTKRLLYRVRLPDNIFVLFSHFSLDRNVRVHQFEEVKAMVDQCPGDVILLADFNIMHGFKELDALTSQTNLRILNDESKSTFQFHRRELALDLCLCSEPLQNRLTLDVIDQPYSDHDALLITL